MWKKESREDSRIVMHLLLQPDMHHGEVVHERPAADKDGFPRFVELVEGADPGGLFARREGVEGYAGDGTRAFDGGGVAGGPGCAG